LILDLINYKKKEISDFAQSRSSQNQEERKNKGCLLHEKHDLKQVFFFF